MEEIDMLWCWKININFFWLFSLHAIKMEKKVLDFNRIDIIKN